MFIVYGEPKGKDRPRLTRQGHAFTPKPTKDYEARVIEAFRTAYPYFVRYEKGVPLRFKVIAYYGIPASTPQKQRALMLEDIVKPTKRADEDNILKICQDALNGIAWYDDSQITNGGCIKRYAEEPRVEIIISEDK